MECDVLVIGCGAAGLSAASYAARAGYSVLAIDSLAPGGQMLYIDEIENYPGQGTTSGYALAESFEKQATAFGARIEFWGAKSIRKEGERFIVETTDGTVTAKAVIYAAGARHRHLGCQGEEEYQGKGVSYCATCDGPFFKGRRIAVVGGGDTALTDALYLSRLASEVHIIHRRSEFRGQKALQDRVMTKENIILHMERNVVSINGDGRNVKSVTLSDGSELECDAVFIFVGIVPNSELLDGMARLEGGFVWTDDHMMTSVPGLFAAGDVRTTPFRQVVTAASDGATAAHAADSYIQNM